MNTANDNQGTQKATATDAAPEFALEAPVVASGRLRAKYAQHYDVYAQRFGVTTRTIKRWVSAGKEAKDECPLDAPKQLPAWWDRNMQYAMPVKVLAACNDPQNTKPAAAEKSVSQTSQEDKTKAGAAPASEGQRRESMELGKLESVGLVENLVAIGRIHRANLELLDKAFKTGVDEAELQLRNRNFEQSSRMLAQAQRLADEYQQSRGDLVSIEDVKREFLRVHMSMAQSLVGLLVSLGVTRERAVRATDTWFRHLRESKFADGCAPELKLEYTAA